MKCLSCLSISGVKRISPGEVIFENERWMIDHAYPTSLPGWLVIIPKRHIEALHELTSEEFAELGTLQERTVRVLRQQLGSTKEYLACFAEREGFNHIHFHVVPKTAGFPEEFRGSKAFGLLMESPSNATPETIAILCSKLRVAFE